MKTFSSLLISYMFQFLLKIWRQFEENVWKFTKNKKTMICIYIPFWQNKLFCTVWLHSSIIKKVPHIFDKQHRCLDVWLAVWLHFHFAVRFNFILTKACVCVYFACSPHQAHILWFLQVHLHLKIGIILLSMPIDQGHDEDPELVPKQLHCS